MSVINKTYMFPSRRFNQIPNSKNQTVTLNCTSTLPRVAFEYGHT